MNLLMLSAKMTGLYGSLALVEKCAVMDDQRMVVDTMLM